MSGLCYFNLAETRAGKAKCERDVALATVRIQLLASPLSLQHVSKTQVTPFVLAEEKNKQTDREPVSAGLVTVFLQKAEIQSDASDRILSK